MNVGDTLFFDVGFCFLGFSLFLLLLLFRMRPFTCSASKLLLKREDRFKSGYLVSVMWLGRRGCRWGIALSRLLHAFYLTF
ncbi:uncharacterized protein BO97DRAFT_260727 [Aspergillus homomorphus CBS 101889]|uniref:Uncharacterized protein n=1 Tax=Aspergillus homomorphus (strain CBS 101889) TaxID=1450537 RepID=A0A395I755_ASPHC|nr:hypothetical protein BO97DRAFT_260727 [Aspergillus homomorphus CBS 101889]RAL14928.1 hypothetical protein BO97DRAFT_260727 [Aspergillus homomorphus CBS 101889]